MPVMEYLLDRIDRDALMKTAAADEKERKGRECEARFYVAEDSSSPERRTRRSRSSKPRATVPEELHRVRVGGRGLDKVK